MNELVKEKTKLLLDDLIKMEKLEKETGKNYFTIQLFAIRVKEIYKLLEENNNVKDKR